MSDYLGPNQTRVLDDTNRSFESVVYQRKKPPLSSEVNLTSDLASIHAQDVAKLVVPSGWAVIGDLKDETPEVESFSGDVICSSSYAANTVKLIALDKGVETQSLVACVNGWNVVVQGTSSGDENNIILLDAPSTIGNRVDFVFLEVWRYLLQPDDVVYSHGNFLYGGVNYSNDLIDPAAGIETSLRIQLQYRIRVAPTNIESYPSGFDPTTVFAQGSSTTPLTCTSANFSPVPGDPGLWRAGAGDAAAFNTVDGYTYAIPMFAIARRNTSDYSVDIRSNGAGKALADYLNDEPSDRPDNRYSDWVVSDDILDMRSKATSSDNMKELCESSFQKLTSGKLRGKLEKITLGEDLFAKTIVQVDAVSNIDKSGSTLIKQTNDGIRRIFSNAAINQPASIIVKTVNDKSQGTIGFNWAASDEVEIETTGYPTGSTIVSVEEVYTLTGIKVSPGDYTVADLGTSTASITIVSGSSIIGNSYPLTVDYTIGFASGLNGLTRLPEEMLEFRNENITSEIIASTDNDIPVRSASPVSTTQGVFQNMLSNKGGNTTEAYNFGHQMTYHVVGDGSNIVRFNRTLFTAYNILGVVSVRVGVSYLTPTSVSRSLTEYEIILPSTVAIGTDIELVLYVGTKFFEINKQSRAITDTLEMSELVPVETATGSLTSFTLDSTNQAIQALGSNISVNGFGIAYVNNVQTTLLTPNSGLPTDSTKFRAEIEFSSAPASGALIEIPVLMKSAISSVEGYNFLYHAVPYQGLLDSTTTGVIEAVGPSLTTTAGSGAITDTTYSTGTATFTLDSTTVQGTGTGWLSGAKAGYVIHSDTAPTKKYAITEVLAEDSLTISTKSEFSAGGSYSITAEGVPFYRANIMDRLPTYDSTNDSNGRSENISTAVSDGFPVLETRIVSKVQDIVDSTAGSVVFGVNSADRGRSQVHIPDAPLGLGNLGLKFEKLDSTGNYQKTYQSYILNKENNGRLYLMVVGSETDGSNSSRYLNEGSNLDTVDIFEMPGRPLTVRRTD